MREMSAMPTAELIGRLRTVRAWAATPPKSARAWGVLQVRTRTVAGVAAHRPNRASRIGRLGI